MSNTLERKPRVRTLTKKDIEDKLEMKFEGRKLTVKGAVDALFESIRELLMTADPDLRIEIRDFGVFEVKTTKAKPKARNLKTGEFVYVPPRKKMHFKAGKLLKEFLKKPLS
ncbi:MAG: integration host factor subunit beta [Ignavibacteria bacterium]|nr:integration host factor subunit beta [Ignavibacteria bacterium]